MGCLPIPPSSVFAHREGHGRVTRMVARKRRRSQILDEESRFPELVNTDPDWWSNNVPTDLRPVVLAVRLRYGRAATGEWASTTRRLCNAHLRTPDRDEAVVLEDIRPSDIAIAGTQITRFKSLLRQKTSPAAFKAFLDLYTAGLAEPGRQAFSDLLKRAREQAILVISDPVAWAEAHVKHLVRSHRFDIHTWVLEACDHTDSLLDPYQAVAEALRNPSNAPELIRMEPAGIFPYDESRIWKSLEEQSWHFTTLLADGYVRRMDKVIEDAALGARIDSPPPSATPRRTAKQGSGRTKRSRLAPQEAKRQESIKRVAAAGYKGLQYAAELDRGGVKPPLNWEPRTYKDAYNHPNRKWRQALQDEKYRLTN